MKFLKLTGGNKESRDFAEKFLDKIGFEKDMHQIAVESLMFEIPFEETGAYKKFIEKHKIK